MATYSDPGSVKAPTSTLTKVVIPLVLPVAAAILATAFTPVGEGLRNALFPTSSTVRGMIRLQNQPLAGAAVSVDEMQATTDASGAFVLGKLKQGDHTLLVEALGARSRRVSFSVKRGSDATDLGALDVDPSLRLAGEGSGGFVPPDREDAGFGTIPLSYDLTIWLEGDANVLGQVSKVTYRLPDPSPAEPEGGHDGG